MWCGEMVCHQSGWFGPWKWVENGKTVIIVVSITFDDNNIAMLSSFS